ncbi:MAG: hypothetical protein PHO91_03160 [Patescibacteria group bacterium]|nr:hypothetical protein [Patescibacteria group bacterium]
MSKIAWQSFGLVFRRPSYIFLALAFLLAFFSLMVWLSDRSLLSLIIITRGFAGLAIINESLLFYQMNSSPLSMALSPVIALLSSINFSLFVYYLKRRLQIAHDFGLGIFGSVLGILGIGCASCGSVIIASFFGLAGSLWLARFPFQGAEIGVLAVLTLLFSIYLLTKKIANPLACDNRK